MEVLPSPAEISNVTLGLNIIQLDFEGESEL